MPLKRSLFRLALIALTLIASVFAPSFAPAAEPSTAALVAEMRRSFTLDGKPIPPEIFRDFGDGDMADSGGIWVTVDAKAAIGSNLYFDEITRNNGWVSQKKAATPTSDAEVTDYTYIGMTENGLLVVLASYRGGGTGIFYTLHILDLSPAQAFDLDGKIYDQINLTNVRSVILGDRWDGKVTISKNEITVVTTRGPDVESGARRTMTIEAKRP
jgi:hypothetical protein